MSIMLPPRFHRAARFALGVSFAGVLAACGGGGNDGPGDVLPPVVEVDTAPLVLTDEQRDDGTYALYRVDARAGSKLLLDQGAKAPYSGHIIGQRAFFVRAISIDTGNGAVTDSDLFSVRLDGGDLKQLTMGPDRDERMLPLGDRLVFSRVRKVQGGTQTRDVMSVRQDGNDLTELATDAGQDELAMVVGSSADAVVIEATAPDGKKSLWTRPADGSLPAVSIAAPEQYLAFRTRVGDRIIFTTPGRVFSRRVDGSGLRDLFENQGNRYYDVALGDSVFANERVFANGGITEHLHVAKVDGSQAPSLFAMSSMLVGSTHEMPDRVFLSKLVGQRHEFYVAPIDTGLGAPRLLSTSDRFGLFSSIVGDAVIAQRIRYDDPDIGLSTEIVSLRETPTGVQEVVLAERADLFVDTRAVNGRLFLNTVTGLSNDGWPVIKHFAVAADGTNLQPLVEDGPGSVHESIQARQDGQVIFRRTEYKLDGSESLGSELLSVRAADGVVVRLSPFSKNAHVVPKY